jgi:hypothetical protein
MYNPLAMSVSSLQLSTEWFPHAAVIALAEYCGVQRARSLVLL